ncbi:MAG: DegQ family serine endoprotease [Alphaproteobacteria bacterium]|nr:MAG: DegQ family serine endoprotease [Alphaproteobacteria bacterium]
MSGWLVKFVSGWVLLVFVLSGVTVAGTAVPESRGQIQLSFAPVVKAVAPAVVNVYSRRVVKTENPFSRFFDDPLFRHFFGDDFGPGLPRERVQQSLGSGVIVSADGTIVTNNHVIGEADEIIVALADRREFEAEVIMTDESTDLAVLKIDAEGEKLPYLELRDSDTVEVGDLVLAIGNPFGVGQTVTSGIVSAVARTNVGITDYQFFIQTDAAINPGNSGGALVTLDGKLVGVNTAIFSRSGGSNGIGFAIPANMVSTVVSAALTDGKVVRPWLGASGQAVTSDIARSLGLERPVGVLVDEIYEGGPADDAGIRVGDVIVAVNGKEVFSPEGLRFRLRIGDKAMGDRVPVTLLRSGQKRTVNVKLEAAPEDPPRNVTVIEGNHFFNGIKVANLSPAFAEELRLDPMLRGVVVLDLARQSPALRYRLLRPGDVIVEVNDTRVVTIEDLKQGLRRSGSFSYRVRRGDRVIECAQTRNGAFACRQ